MLVSAAHPHCTHTIYTLPLSASGTRPKLLGVGAAASVQVFNAHTLAVRAEELVSIAFVSSVVFNTDNTALISVAGDANCHVTGLVPRQAGG